MRVREKDVCCHEASHMQFSNDISYSSEFKFLYMSYSECCVDAHNMLSHFILFYFLNPFFNLFDFNREIVFVVLLNDSKTNAKKREIEREKFIL
jgi:hypothetical protein